MQVVTNNYYKAIVLIKIKNSTGMSLHRLCSVLSAGTLTDELLLEIETVNQLAQVMRWIDRVKVSQTMLFKWSVEMICNSSAQLELDTVAFVYKESGHDVSEEIVQVSYQLLKDRSQQFKGMAVYDVTMQSGSGSGSGSGSTALDCLTQTQLLTLLQILLKQHYTATNMVKSSLTLLNIR
jgi:hypothetical protein